MKKNYIKKILLIIVILSFTFFITYIGTRSSYAQEIIDKSYETAIKEEVIFLFYPESKQFDIDEIKALKNERNSLETLYQGWMDCDMNICELIEDSARDTVEDLARDFKEKQAKKKDKER